MTARPTSPLPWLLHALLQPRLGTRIDLACGLSEELLGVSLGVLAPFLLKSLVDDLGHARLAPHLLVPRVVGFVLAWSAGSAITSLKPVHTTRIVERLCSRLIDEALSSQLPMLAQGRRGDTGRVLGALERLPTSLQLLIDTIVWRAISLVLQTSLSLAALCAAVPWRYPLILAVTLAAFYLVSDLSARRFDQSASQANLAAADLSKNLGEVLRNARRVVFNGAADQERQMVGRCAARRGAAGFNLARLILVMSLLQYAAVSLGVSTLLVMSGSDILAGRLGVGDFVLLQAYAFRLALPLGGFAVALRQAGLALANVKDCLAMTTEGTVSLPDATPSPAAPADLTVEHLAFSYPGAQTVFADLSAKITAGALVAIVGANGSGKSTLAQLMAGLLTPSAGRIFIHGQDVGDIAISARHRHVLYVPQFIGLFNRSLRENGLYPPSRLCPAGLRRRLQDWAFYDEGGPLDLERRVGEQGERLSGGQIQKLELARLHGVQVPVMILDESTSALDSHSVQAIIGSLRRQHRSTLILVTHHCAIAAVADQVLFLAGGELAAAGRHRDLLSLPNYRQLWSGF